MKPGIRASGAALILAGLASGAARAADAPPEWVVRAGKTAVPANLAAGPPAADSVTVWRQIVVTAAAGSGATKTFEREAVRILAQSGTEAAIFRSAYDDDSRVDVEGAWSIHADGTSETLRSRDIASAQLANPEYFTDTFVVGFQAPHPGVGDIAAYALTRTSHRGVSQWILPLQESRPVLAQQVAIELPAGWRHRWRLTRAPDGYAGPLSGEGGEHASYDFGPQRAIPDEEMAPPEPDRSPGLEIAVDPPAGTASGLAFVSWNDVGGWCSRKTAPARQDAPFVGLPPAPADPVRTAAAWVQDHIRYVAVEVGEGGYVPRPPSTVARRLFGDCKDKAFLLISLLKRYHISALPVLTRPRSVGEIDRDFPSPIQFNHLIVAVPEPAPTGLPAEIRLASGPAVIFDPTDDATPYGTLRGDLQGARGLVVGETASELVDFPYAPIGDNRLSRAVEASVLTDRSLSMAVTEITSGAESRRAAYRDESDAEREERLRRLAQRRIPGSRISKIEIHHLDERDQPLELGYRLLVPGWARSSAGATALPLLPLSVGPDRIPDLSRRRSPVELGAPGRRELTVRFDVEPGFRAGPLPDPVDASNEFGEYHFSASIENGKIVAHESWERKKPEIPLASIASWSTLEDASAKARARLASLLSR